MTSMGIQARGLSLRAHFGGAKHADALATHYFALFDGDPFAGGVEPTDGVGGYGRAAVSNIAGVWGTPALGTTQISNQADIVWPTATGLWSIEDPLPYWGIMSANTAGALWYAGLLPTPVIVADVGDQPRVLAGGLILRQGG